MFAADEGHPEICEMLLKAGADAFATDNNGMTALRRAENQDHPSFGRALVIEALKKHMACNDAQQNKDNKRCGRFGCTIA